MRHASQPDSCHAPHNPNDKLNDKQGGAGRGGAGRDGVGWGGGGVTGTAVKAERGDDWRLRESVARSGDPIRDAVGERSKAPNTLCGS